MARRNGPLPLLCLLFLSLCKIAGFVRDSYAGTPTDNDQAMLAYVTVAAANSACKELGYVGDTERVKAAFMKGKNVDLDYLLKDNVFGKLINEAINERVAKMTSNGERARNCAELAQSLTGDAKQFFYKQKQQNDYDKIKTTIIQQNVEIARSLQGQLPLIIDEKTKLTSVYASGLVIVYTYKVDYFANELNISAIMKNTIMNKCKSDSLKDEKARETIRIGYDAGFEMKYMYFDRVGELIGSFSINKESCRKA